MLYVRPSVRPSDFQNLAKQNKFQSKTMFTTGETVGLAEWIIDDTCVVLTLSYGIQMSLDAFLHFVNILIHMPLDKVHSEKVF